MKAVILAALAGLILVLLATALFRACKVERRARALTLIYLLCLGLLALVHATTPDDLGVLPPGIVAPRYTDLIFAVFLLSAGFFGGVLQIYNLADRGLSLRMLIDILQSPSEATTAGDVMTRYGGGQGIAWMYEKRLQGLQDTGLVRIEDDVLVLTPKGRRAADIFAALRRYCRLGEEARTS